MTKRSRSGSSKATPSLAEVQARRLDCRQGKNRARRLLAKRHYLGDVHAVGEQLWYALTDGQGDGRPLDRLG